MAFEFAPAYLIHRRDWGESGALVELFFADHGRQTLAARGINQPNSKRRALLAPFRPLLVSSVSKRDMQTMTSVEANGQAPLLLGAASIAGLYLNELLHYLLPANEPAKALYASYTHAIAQLNEPAIDRVLRGFERVLLDTIGLGPSWQLDARATEIDPEQSYRWLNLEGWAPSDARSPDALSGATIRALANDAPLQAEQRQRVNRLFRRLIDAALGGRALRSRELWAWASGRVEKP